MTALSLKALPHRNRQKNARVTARFSFLEGVTKGKVRFLPSQE
jgi:hypothetical protein